MQRGFGGGGKRSPKDHAAKLSLSAAAMIAAVAQRPTALGVEPRLVMVVKTDVKTVGVASESDWANAGLRVVDSAHDRRVVAFGSDNELTTFLSRAETYGEGAPAGQKGAVYESFFGGIDEIRPYGRQDRLGERLSEALSGGGADLELTVDCDFWYSGDLEETVEWAGGVRAAVEHAGGEVVDSFASETAGVVQLRVRAAQSVVSELADVDYVAQVELVSEAQSDVGWAGDYDLASLSQPPGSSDDSPVIGMIDSGINGLHPIISGTVIEAVALNGAFYTSADENGHGTAVASLLVRGSLEKVFSEGEWGETCSIFSVRVLDKDLRLPVGRLASSEINEAIRFLAARGVKVINISMADSSVAFTGLRAPALSAIIDSLVRELGLVIVLPVGNIKPASYYFPFDADLPIEYAGRLAGDTDSVLLDPAPAALALTVGGMVGALKGSLSISQTPVGIPGWPAPFTARGPGIGGAVKPELSAVAGTFAFTKGTPALVMSDLTGVAVADGRPSTTSTITTSVGTSLAAPLVSRVVALTEQRYPSASANLLRALTLQSTSASGAEFDGGSVKGAQRNTRRRWLLGYGTPSEKLAVAGSNTDVTVFAEDVIAVDDVHLYSIPIPDAFFVDGNSHPRGISVSLAYDPAVRARRLDYMSNRMQFDLTRGLDPSHALDLFLADMESDGDGPSTLSELSSRHRPALEPSRAVRSSGANQLAVKTWNRALREPAELGREFLLAVQNINRWDTATALQPYAVAVRMWVDPALPEVREDVRARVEANELRTELVVRA